MNKKSILFYVIAVIFLAVAIYMGVASFQSLAASAAQYGVSLATEWVTVVQSIIASAGGFFAFSIIFCGIAMIFNDLAKITKPATENVESVVETETELDVDVEE